MDKFSPKQAAEILQIPASSLRRYRQEWAPILSAPDEKRRYTQEDIEALRIIRDLTGKKTREEIEQILLGPTEPFTFEEPLPEPNQGAAIQSIEFFNSFIEQLTEGHNTTLQAKDETIEVLKSENERLRDELDQAKTPWWKRWWPARANRLSNHPRLQQTIL